MDSLPTPPNEELLKSQGHKRSHPASKPVKTVHRSLKRNGGHGHPPSPAHESHSQHGDGRHKRVWKACERCRMKKTKCDGEFPCKRCKDDGLVCTAGTRKKTEYKQLPRGYAEVLENTQFALVATVHKLYAMVRNQKPWDLGEPELNDRGQPVIHDIASKLGCIRPHSDLDLPVHSVFPEDEAGLAELARQLEEQQQQQQQQKATPSSSSLPNSGSISSCNASIKQETDSTASEDLDYYSDLDADYRKTAFGGGGGTASAVTMSPASLCYGDFDLAPPPSAHSPGSITAHPHPHPHPHSHPPTFSPWLSSSTTTGSRPASTDFSSSGPHPHPHPHPHQHHQQQHQHQHPFLPSNGPAAASTYLDLDMLNQGLLESSFGTIKPHVLSCPNPDVMLGMGDPMIFSGYEVDGLPM